MEETNKKIICAKFEVDEETLKRVVTDNGMENYNFYDSITSEFGWVADSGIGLIGFTIVDE